MAARLVEHSNGMRGERDGGSAFEGLKQDPQPISPGTPTDPPGPLGSRKMSDWADFWADVSVDSMVQGVQVHSRLEYPSFLPAFREGSQSLSDGSSQFLTAASR